MRINDVRMDALQGSIFGEDHHGIANEHLFRCTCYPCLNTSDMSSSMRSTGGGSFRCSVSGFIAFLVCKNTHYNEKISTLLPIIILSLTSASLYGQVLSYDGFSSLDYTESVTINGGSGGSGWSSNWSVNLQSIDNPLRYQGSSVSLKYTDLQGRSLLTTPGSLELVEAGAGAGEIRRSFDSLTGDVWISFLNMRTEDSTQNWDFWLMDSAGGEEFKINYITASGGRLAIYYEGTQWSYQLNFDPKDTAWTPANDADFYVMQISNVGSGNADASVTLWANPVDLTDLDAGSAASVVRSGMQIDELGQFGFNKGRTPTGYFDELRIGSSYLDVTAVPEPSVYSILVGLFAFAFIRYSRGRKGLER